MKIIKGQLLEVNHCRKGKFSARATQDFDSDKEQWYPVITLQRVEGIANDWVDGEEIPCKRELCTITVIEQLSIKERDAIWAEEERLNAIRADKMTDMFMTVHQGNDSLISKVLDYGCKLLRL